MKGAMKKLKSEFLQVRKAKLAIEKVLKLETYEAAKAHYREAKFHLQLQEDSILDEIENFKNQ